MKRKLKINTEHLKLKLWLTWGVCLLGTKGLDLQVYMWDGIEGLGHIQDGRWNQSPLHKTTRGHILYERVGQENMPTAKEGTGNLSVLHFRVFLCDSEYRPTLIGMIRETLS